MTRKLPAFRYFCAVISLYMFFIALFPVFAAFVSWVVFKIFTLILLQGFYKKRNELARTVADLIAEQDPAQKLEHMISAEKIKAYEPLIGEKISAFLDQKLQKKIPVLAMFSGDKLMLQAKEVVMEEIMESLPALMQEIAHKELNNEQIAAKISTGISQLPGAEWERKVNTLLSPVLSKIQMAAAVLGFILGILFVLFLVLYYYIFLQGVK